ncbi:XdhC family protein [Kiloniella sp. EL199]|uniref:XdhC family protein n=1 Tax=Kiloniella sp. EL199 TaxID=2107581 RepID=UPI000EA3A7D7|nr:XdhC/CoxI family protein [Kiloniella sp. EL199]
MTASDTTLDLIENLRKQGKSFCIATILRTENTTSARPGAKAVITTDGDLFGFVGGGCVTSAVKRGAQEVISDGYPKMIRIKPRKDVRSEIDVDGIQLHKSSCPSGGTIEVFLEPMRAPKNLFILGASPIAQALLPLAKGLGYQTTVICSVDDKDKILGAASYLTDFNLPQLNSSDAVIVATQGKRDLDALRAMSVSEAGYKGMVCSRKKIATLNKKLFAETGKYQTSVADLHAPAGLNIGAIEPEEIALSVISEIVSVQRLGNSNKQSSMLLQQVTA